MRLTNISRSINSAIRLGPMTVLAATACLLINTAVAGEPIQNLQRFQKQTSQAASYMTRSELEADYIFHQALDYMMAPIHSKEQLTEYLTQTAHTGSPLDALPPDARQRFLSSLVFSHGTVGSFDYADLQRLNVVQVYEILALFGAQDATRLITGSKIIGENNSKALRESISPYSDHAGYACQLEPDKSASHTCYQSDAHICMSGC